MTAKSTQVIHSNLSTAEKNMTLKEITDLLEVRHNDAMKTVKIMMKDQLFGNVTKLSYRTSRGNTYETYGLNKRQSIAVASRLNTNLLMRIIDRWQELENKEICHTPLTHEHKMRLSRAVDERVEQSSVSRGELLSQIRQSFDVRSWSEIKDSDFASAMVLVKTLVLSSEELPSPATNNNVLQLSQLRDYAQNELGLPDLRYMDRQEAEKLILSKANADNDDIDSKDRAGFVSMRMEWIKALVMASEIGYKNISQKAKDDYALAVKSLAFDVHCAVNEMAKI